MARIIPTARINANLYSSLHKLANKKENFEEYPGYAKNAIPYFKEKYGIASRKSYIHNNGRVEVVNLNNGSVMYLISNPKKKYLVEKVVIYYNNGDKFDEIIGLQVQDPSKFIGKVKRLLRGYIEENRGDKSGNGEKRILVVAKGIDSDDYDYVILRMTHRDIRRVLLPTLSKAL